MNIKASSFILISKYRTKERNFFKKMVLKVRMSILE